MAYKSQKLIYLAWTYHCQATRLGRQYRPHGSDGQQGAGSGRAARHAPGAAAGAAETHAGHDALRRLA